MKERGDKGGLETREERRERERRMLCRVGRVTISRGLVGRLEPRFHHHPPPRLCPSVKRNNYCRKSGAHACGAPRRDPGITLILVSFHPTD